MRETLKEMPSIKDAYDEIERLDKLFAQTFNRNPKIFLFVFSVGDPRVQLTNGITIEWEKGQEKEVEFYKEQATK